MLILTGVAKCRAGHVNWDAFFLSEWYLRQSENVVMTLALKTGHLCDDAIKSQALGSAEKYSELHRASVVNRLLKTK